MDLDSLERAIGRTLRAEEKAEILVHTRRAYRWTFLVSGLEHPKFVEIVGELTMQGQGKIAAAAAALSGDVPSR